jgi:WD40 repeat protein
MSSDIQRSISASFVDRLRDFRLKDFTGRTWVFDKLNTWLEADTPRTFLLTGGPGCGKSTLAARLVQLSLGESTAMTYPHLGRHCLTYFHFCQTLSADSTLEPLRFIQALSQCLADQYAPFALALMKTERQEITINASLAVGKVESGAKATTIAIDKLPIGNLSAREAFDRLVRKPLELLYTPDFHETILILVDALDEAMTYNLDKNLVTLLSHITSDAADLPHQVRFLLTTRPDPRILYLIREPSLDLIADTPADVDDVRVYAFHRLHVLADPRRGILADRVAKEGKGNFLYARYVLDDLLPRIEQGEDVSILPLPKDLEDIYRQFLQRELGQNLQKDWFERYGPVLGTLAAARGEGLTRTQLAGVLKRPLSEMDNILLTCTQYLTGLQPNGPFRIYHQSFRDFLLAENEYPIYPDEADQAIACFFLWKYKDNWPTCQERYALQYTPSHLLRAIQQAEQQQGSQLWPELEALLCDLRFVEAKCAAGLMYDLEADYDVALATLPEAEQEQERTWQVACYTQDLIAYARVWSEARARRAKDPANSPIPAPEDIPLPTIATVPLWTDDEIRADTEWRIRTPTRLDRLRAFASFVQAESHHLVQFAALPGFCIQQAYNSADTGPVVSAAECLLEADMRVPLLLQQSAQRPFYTPHPALLRTLEEHTDKISSNINSISVTPDGRTAVGNTDGTVRVWDLTTGQCLHTLMEHIPNVNSVSATPDGQTAVTGSTDGTIRVWDLARGELRYTLGDDTPEHIDYVWSVTADGQTAVTERDGNIRVWDLARRELRYTLLGYDVSVCSVTPDGRTAVSASLDKAIRVWDLTSGECRCTFHQPAGLGNVSVKSLSITPDGRTAISGNTDGTIRVWDLTSGRCRRTLKGPNTEISSVSVTADGQVAVSAGRYPAWIDYAVRVWDLASGACRRTLEGHTSVVTSVSVTADGQTAVSGSMDHTVRVWNVTNGAFLRTLERHTDSVQSISVTPDGRTAVSGSFDAIRVWDMTSGQCLRTLENTRYVDSVSVTPDGQTVVSADGMTHAIHVWNVASGAGLRTIERNTGRGRVKSIYVRLMPGGRTAVTGMDGTVRVWDLASGRCLHMLEDIGSVSSVSVTPDGRIAVSGSFDKTVRVWDLANGACRRTLEGHTDRVWRVRVTPDGRTVVSVSKDHTLRVWDLASGTCRHTLVGHSDWVESVSVTPDGRIAVSRSDDHTVRVWDLACGQCLAIFPVPDKVNALSEITAGGQFGFGTGSGLVIFVTLRNVPLAPPHIMAVRLWLSGTGSAKGYWDDKLTARCACCGQQFIPPQRVLDAIHGLTAYLAPNHSPCLELPPEAWDDPQLLSECPHCHQPLRFNPFVVDRRKANL